MPRPRKEVPSYRHHKQSGQAIVTLNLNGTRKNVLLGRYGTPESRAEYERVLARLRLGSPVAVSTPAAAQPDISVNEVLVGFMRWAATHYRTPAGETTPEVRELKFSVGPLKELFGFTPRGRSGRRRSPWCEKR